MKLLILLALVTALLTQTKFSTDQRFYSQIPFAESPLESPAIETQAESYLFIPSVSK